MALDIPTEAVHHIAKNADGTTPYGSVYHRNSPRSAIEVRKEQDEDGTLFLALFHTKLNDGIPHPPLGVKVTRTEDAILIAPADVLRETATLAARFPLSFRIEHHLRADALYPEDLARLLPAKLDTVERTLRRLKTKERVTRLDDGRYGLADQRHQE